MDIMDIMDIDYTDPGLQNFIIQRCEEEEERKTNVLNAAFSKNIVVRLGPKVACKFGTAVREAEADALTFASRHLNPAIIKVPSVFQYFTRPDGEWTMGYLVMTLVEGASLEHMPPGEALQHVDRIMRAIQHIHGFCGSRPGPLDRSVARGLMWSEFGFGPRINSRDDLQKFLDTALEEIKSDIKVDAMNMALSFCHLDIHPHNFIVTPDQSIWLLDWSYAGFYPAAFETWSIRLENIIRENAFMIALGSQLVTCTSPAELALADALMHANLEERERNLPDPLNFPPASFLPQPNSGPWMQPPLPGSSDYSSDSTHILRRLLSTEALPPDIAAASAAASRATGRQEDTGDIISRLLYAETYGPGAPPEGRRQVPPGPLGLGPPAGPPPHGPPPVVPLGPPPPPGMLRRN
ncbi:hypothetical protein LTR20_006342 [Exophiala xenobiotica]|nr:hypothetical protein LTR93_005920 [Exophiala xenobiotica]KAK5358172.1 hypothetical protein LTS13_011011 [Exophiala xenobiotica]KAK5395214.1 hypothetical protein LTR79_007831 [Exophiala xenobiotica]KAK5412784.1 hypothetical protein LTR90_006905 [Exophiala xenobiotica]KAK5461419.1 hypothetical protein LTR20_006342 [Exophiala xenobiotica]